MAVLGIFWLAALAFKPLLLPSIVCDDFSGGRLPEGTVRGVRCRCAGWKIHLEHQAPHDGRDLSVCIGLKMESHTFY